MKRMIISPAQLKMINEAATQILTGTSSNAQTVAQNEKSKSPGQDVTVDITDATPGAEKKNGFAASTATTNPQQIKNFGKMTFGATNNSSVFEGTKRQVELGRMLEMRRTGKVFSKKQLNEMFMETDIAEKIKDNIRELEGAINRIIFWSNTFNEKPSKALAKKVLKDILSNTK